MQLYTEFKLLQMTFTIQYAIWFTVTLGITRFKCKYRKELNIYVYIVLGIEQDRAWQEILNTFHVMRKAVLSDS